MTEEAFSRGIVAQFLLRSVESLVIHALAVVRPPAARTDYSQGKSGSR